MRVEEEIIKRELEGARVVDDNGDDDGHGNGEEEDRISGLPLPLRAEIVSLLPVEEAVRTTVLSKSWTHVWTHFDRLNLCIRSKWCELGRMRDAAQPFKPFLESLARLNVAIRSLSLSKVSGWQQIQGRRPPRDADPPPPGGWGLFSRFLEVLELRDGRLAVASALPFQRCGNLKVLKFSKVVVGVYVLEDQIFPHCKALESMSFSCCILVGIGKPSPESRPHKKARIFVHFRVCAPTSLKSLEFDRVQIRDGRRTLSIKAPGLNTLKIDSPFFCYSTHGPDASRYILELDAPQLVALQVVTHGINNLDVPRYSKYNMGCLRYHLTPNHILHLFLTSSPLQTKPGGGGGGGGGSQFRKLRSLSTDVDLKNARDVAFLLSFLKHCPCLERLYINIPPKVEISRDIFSLLNWEIPSRPIHILGDPEELGDYTFSCLKSIRVRFYTESVREEIHNFLTSLRQRAPNMHQVEVLPVISKAAA